MSKRLTYRDKIGDGQLPNLYWVSLSNDYSYLHDGNMVDWIGDLIPSFKSKGKTIARPFKTYIGARRFCDDLLLGENNGYKFIVNRINIEDRLTGQLYEKTWLFILETGERREDIYGDTSFTETRLEHHGVKFI
jgi:hypothetical protein